MTEYVAPVLSDFLGPPVPVVQVLQIPQVQIIEETVETGIYFWSWHRNFHEFGTAPGRHVTFAVTLEKVDVASLHLDESVRPVRVTRPVVEVLLVVAKYVMYAAPAPVVLHVCGVRCTRDHVDSACNELSPKLWPRFRLLPKHCCHQHTVRCPLHLGRLFSVE